MRTTRGVPALPLDQLKGAARELGAVYDDFVRGLRG